MLHFIQKHISYFLTIGFLTITLVIVTIFTLNRINYRKIVSLKSGLAPIKIIQIVDGKEKEVNITQNTMNILSSILKSDKPFIEESKRQVTNFGVKDILFPPIQEKYIKIVDKNDKKAVEVYLGKVYTLFTANPVNINVDGLTSEALNKDFKNVNLFKTNNQAIYYGLFDIEVPQEALELHKNYIKITQIQNNYLSNLSYVSSDPLRVELDLKTTLALLERLKKPINDELKTLAERHKLTLTNVQ